MRSMCVFNEGDESVRNEEISESKFSPAFIACHYLTYNCIFINIQLIVNLCILALLTLIYTKNTYY